MYVVLLQVFQDIGDDLLVDRDSIVLQKFLGKGAFGAVFCGTIVRKVRGLMCSVAVIVSPTYEWGVSKVKEPDKQGCN